MADWDSRFLELAKHISDWSKDPSTKCGAVIVDHKNVIVSLGFNGFPRGVPDRKQYLEDREEKYLRVIHAEENAILFSREINLGCTIYTWPVSPCNRCASLIIQSGIQRICYPEPRDEVQQSYYRRWHRETLATLEMLKDTGVTICMV